jgi:hypothetical protein
VSDEQMAAVLEADERRASDAIGGVFGGAALSSDTGGAETATALGL